MNGRLGCTILLAMFVVLLTKCNHDPPVAMGIDASSIQSLTLYSLDGGKKQSAKRPPKPEKFHGFVVLGKVEITSPAKRKEIMDALYRGISSSNRWDMAKCFWPRHGIRVSVNDVMTDYVICFECHQLHVSSNGKTETEPTTNKPQVLLNKLLRAENIPLAPGMKE